MLLAIPVMPELTGTGTASGACMAFDYGTRHIGMAIGDRLLQTARPLVTVNNRNGTPDWQAIEREISDWQPADIVLGWPLTQDGDEQPLCNHIRGFVKQLTKRFDLPVHLVDERFSSMAAQEHIRSMRQNGQLKRRSKHTDVDKVAAALILETWFTQKS